MTKKGLLKKSLEFKDYEDKTLNSVKERFAKYKNALDNLDLALDIGLSWYNRLVSEDISFSRIDFKDGYICHIGITIRRKEDPEPYGFNMYQLHLSDFTNRANNFAMVFLFRNLLFKSTAKDVKRIFR